jgi:hypothetical protein
VPGTHRISRAIAETVRDLTRVASSGEHPELDGKRVETFFRSNERLSKLAASAITTFASTVEPIPWSGPVRFREITCS